MGETQKQLFGPRYGLGECAALCSSKPSSCVAFQHLGSFGNCWLFSDTGTGKYHGKGKIHVDVVYIRCTGNMKEYDK